MSGLKINLEKNALLGLNCVEIEVEGLAREIGCELAHHIYKGSIGWKSDEKFILIICLV